MATLKRVLVAGLALVITQGCGGMKELRQRNRELADLNQNQGQKIRVLNDRIRQLEQDLARQREVTKGERDISKQLQSMVNQGKADRDKLERELRALADSTKGVAYVETAEGMTLVLENAIVFASGQNTLQDAGKRALAQVAGLLRGKSEDIRIDGHTDSDPIKSSSWLNNHDLACGRALAVFAELKTQGINESRMYVAGFGPNRPVASNSSKAGKAKNRRVELLLMKAGAATTPGPLQSTPGAADTVVPK